MKEGVWSMPIPLLPSLCFSLPKALKDQLCNSDAQAQTYLPYENIFYQMQYQLTYAGVLVKKKNKKPQKTAEVEFKICLKVVKKHSVKIYL